MKPILFNTEMVRAILDGRKTTTRRAIKLDLGLADTDKNDSSYLKIPDEYGDHHDAKDLCRYKAGDILYVREKTYGIPGGIDNHDLCYATHCPCGLSDEEHLKIKGWRPSIHMPREAARIFLKVTNIRVERLQDITEDGCKAEVVIGLDPWIYADDSFYERNGLSNDYLRASFAGLWNSTIKKQDIDKYGWGANPWVWVIEFEVSEVKAI